MYGTYELYISVGTLDGTPVLELPYEGSDSHKRYKLGKIIIEQTIRFSYSRRKETADLEMTYQKIYQTLEQEGTDR